MQTAKGLTDMGLQLRADEVITQTGFTPPMPGEKVVGTGVPAGAMGPPGLGGPPGAPPGLGGPQPPPGAPEGPPGAEQDKQEPAEPGNGNQPAPARELEEAPV